MVVNFGLYDAGNDWWWAIDNVSVSAVPEPSSLTLVVVSALGLFGLRRRR
ncbi:MAG: PEP-CTERM sorting domain-containing protein [Pirellulaceae bacterium]